MDGSYVIRRTGPRSVQGLPGWEVEEHFPYRLVYREGDRVLRYSAELSSGPDVSILNPPEAERTDWPVIWAEAQALLRRAD